MVDAGSQAGDHIFPVVVVGGEQHYADAFVVVFLQHFGILKTVASRDAAKGGCRVIESFNKEVGKVAVKLPLYAAKPSGMVALALKTVGHGLVRKRTLQVAADGG